MSYTPPVNQPYLPDVRWAVPTPSPVAQAQTINSVASSPTESQMQVVAENAPLRIIYGRAMVGAQIADVLTYQNKLVMILVWGEGEIEAIETMYESDAAPNSGIVFTHYTGTAGQTADATLVAAYASHSITYADTLAGIAYTVAVIPAGTTAGAPTFTAIIRGRKIYDPRTTLTGYSDNPALALSDFITSTVYGMGKTVNAASLTATADFCDELCGAEKRRLIGLVINNVSTCEQWLETLRTYAGCYVSPEGSELRLIPDKDVASTGTFDGSTILAGSFKLKKKGIQQIPTVMEIRYTDTSIVPWTEKSAIVKAAGVDAGTTPRRESQIYLPGITRYTQAYREAVERINKLTLCDLAADFVSFDEAMAVQVGDVWAITHPVGLTSKLMRVMHKRAVSPGRWQLSLLEHDPAVYSDAVAAIPTYTDTTLPNAAAPPAVSPVVMNEEVFQLDNGTYSSRWRITWAAATYPYLAYYRAELWNGATLIHTTTTREAVWATPVIQEGVTYTAKIVAVSTVGSTGTWATQSELAQGKQLIPGDVPSVSVFEAGGRVHVSWTPAVDIDIWRYEVRYGAVAGAWADTVLLDRVDALTHVTSLVPTGSWTVHVRALDSVQQYSANSATADVTVTSDASSFFVGSYDHTAPGLTNMVSYTIHPTDANIYYVTDDAVDWDTKYPAAMSTYTNELATYHNSVTSTWLGESEDFGLDLGGQWTGTATVADISGTHISYFGYAVAAAPSSFTYVSGLSQKVVGRFARMKHEALTTSTLLVTVPTQNIRLDVIPRSEVGSGTSSASAGVTITLDNVYVATKKITITPLGATARSGVPDNITLGTPTTFDVYVFDDTGTKIVSDFMYEFQGV